MQRILWLGAFLVAALLSARAQRIAPAPPDKAVVYFVRVSGLGALIPFTYFDGSQVIGKFNGPAYLRYECEPGEHLFWAKAENRDAIQADLQPGRIYVVEVLPIMGIVFARVRLIPVNTADARSMRGIRRLLAKQEPESPGADELAALQQDLQDEIVRGLKHAAELRSMDKLDAALTPEQLTAEPKRK
ncbi:MAG: hypothetical protein NW241_04175 [Bacteroidia bacterium]|nr:hypothetical protein [Bacteroidia bacterium]